jgi:hypothetical protein
MSFININIKGDTQTHGQTETNTKTKRRLVSLLLFIQNEESSLKMRTLKLFIAVDLKSFYISSTSWSSGL